MAEVQLAEYTDFQHIEYTNGMCYNVQLLMEDLRIIATAEEAFPFQVSDTEGPTAVLKSITKLPIILMTGGQLLNMKFSPNLLVG